MKPVFKLTADTKDVTEKLANRVIEIAVTDARGLDSDTLEITRLIPTVVGNSCSVIPRSCNFPG